MLAGSEMAPILEETWMSPNWTHVPRINNSSCVDTRRPGHVNVEQSNEQSGGGSTGDKVSKANASTDNFCHLSIPKSLFLGDYHQSSGSWGDASCCKVSKLLTISIHKSTRWSGTKETGLAWRACALVTMPIGTFLFMALLLICCSSSECKIHWKGRTWLLPNALSACHGCSAAKACRIGMVPRFFKARVARAGASLAGTPCLGSSCSRSPCARLYSTLPAPTKTGNSNRLCQLTASASVKWDHNHNPKKNRQDSPMQQPHNENHAAQGRCDSLSKSPLHKSKQPNRERTTSGRGSCEVVTSPSRRVATPVLHSKDRAIQCRSRQKMPKTEVTCGSSKFHKAACTSFWERVSNWDKSKADMNWKHTGIGAKRNKRAASASIWKFVRPPDRPSPAP